MIRFRSLLVPAAVLAVIVAGCSEGGTASGQETERPGDGAAAAEATHVPSGRIELSGYGQDHPGATTVAVTAIEVDDDGDVFVEIEAVASRRGVFLGLLSTILEDDRGNRYEYVRPRENRNLLIGQDTRLAATLAFEGPIDPDARRVTLGLNAEAGELRSVQDDLERGRQYMNTPSFVFADLPLPGVGLDSEASADDGDDGLFATTAVEPEVSQTHGVLEGLEVTVVRITSDGRTVHVDLEVVNDTDQHVALWNMPPGLEDDQGTSVIPVRDEEAERSERRLELGPGEEASATLAFRGAFHPEATELRLTINSPNRDSLGAPRFVFEGLPVPGAGDRPGPSAGQTGQPSR